MAQRAQQWQQQQCTEVNRVCVCVCVCVCCVCVCVCLLCVCMGVCIKVAQVHYSCNSAQACPKWDPIWLSYACFPCAASSQARIHQHHVAESPVLEEGEEDSSHSWAITAVPGTDRGASTRIQVSVALSIACLLQSLHTTASPSPFVALVT